MSENPPAASAAPPPPPPTPPPPLPPVESVGRARFVQFARASWVSVVIAFVANLFMQARASIASGSVADQAVNLIKLSAFGLLMLMGVGAGIAALCGVKRYGSKGILVPALTGLIIWLAMIGLA